MKVYLNSDQGSIHPKYLKRTSSTQWILMIEEPHDVDFEIRKLDEFESDFVESVFQHFAQPMKKLIGE